MQTVRKVDVHVSTPGTYLDTHQFEAEADLHIFFEARHGVMLVHLALNSLSPLRLGLVPGYHELTRFRHHGYSHKELVCLLAIFKRLLAIFKQLRARVRACVQTACV